MKHQDYWKKFVSPSNKRFASKNCFNFHRFKATTNNFKAINPVVDIPADILKSNADIHLPFITKIINLSFENNCFPDYLKLAKVSPVYQKNGDNK